MTAFNLAGLLHEPPGSTREIRLRDHYLNLGRDLELAGPIDADMRLQRTNRGVLLRGQLHASLRRTCARCTDAFVEEVRVPLSEEFLPSVDPVSGAPLTVDAEDAEVPRIDGHHQIELDPVFREELSLTEPVFPLCRPDCPGLCPTCGGRMESGTHEHGDAEIDPRLAGLAALLRDGDDDGR